MAGGFKYTVDEAEYLTWLAPPAAIRRLEPLLSAAEAKTEIYRRLCGGEILSIARTANWHSHANIDVRDFGILGAMLWSFNSSPNDWDLLWKTGTHVLKYVPSSHSTKVFEIEAYGIRFNPLGVDKVLKDAGLTAPEAVSEKPDPAKPLPKAEAERVSRLILDIWGKEVTEVRAVQLAQIISPEHRVSRDPFLAVFRVIRGDKKRGRQALNG